MPVVSHYAEIEGSREKAFAYVNDYRLVPEWMFGVTRFEPITEHVVGLGSQFEADIKVGPKTLHSTVEVVEWVENELIVLDAIKGFTAGTTWRFLETTPESFRVDVHFSYELPGGIAGRALGTLVEPVVGTAIRHVESRLTNYVRNA